MKRTVMFTVAICGAMVAWQFVHSEEPTAAPATTQPFGDQYKTASYAIGYNMGKELKRSKIAFDANLIAQGINDGIAGTASKVTDEQIQAAMMSIEQEAMANMIAERKAVGDKAQKDGEAYLAENGKKAGVTTTKSGLQMETIKEGTGASPKETDMVKVHYTGTLIDGTKFDSSVDRGEPVEFEVNGVIAGWTEALQLMKVGGKARLVIPSQLAYKEQGRGEKIPPNATLVFEVELLEIAKAPATQPGGL